MSTRMSNGPSITRDRGDVRTSSSLNFEFGTAPSLWIDHDLDGLGRDTVSDNNQVASAQLLVCRHIKRRGYEIIRCNGHAAAVVRPVVKHVPGSLFVLRTSG